ncbi:MAG TPA: hypothetical protein VGN72_06830 [Tepidisphaeraceae bacterium]|jgi:signal recognition particle subunit SEC65|nr:hypothetical protein [Tepidisphaeraceae bacterium]
MKRSIILSLCLSLAASPVAVLAVPNEALRDGAETQTRLKSQTQAVATQIEGVLAEFDRNGITGDDVQTLRAIHSVLGSLSASQMQQVVDLLQKARSADTDDAARRNVTQAVVGQKTISSQLGDLLKEYRRQQAMHELSGRLEKLADRQNENFKQSVTLAKETAGRKSEQFSAAQKDALRVQQAEQSALKEEVRQAVSDLTAMAQDPQTAPERAAEAAKKARDEKVEEAATAAAEDLASGNVYRAALNEKKTRDSLRELSRAVAPPKEKLETLQDAVAQVDKAIEQQQQVNEQTKANAFGPKLDEQQADLADRTSLTQQDVAKDAPMAADKLTVAQQKMEQARPDLARKMGPEAAQKQEQALAALNDAKAELEKEIQKEQAKANEPPKDALAAVADLLTRTKQLRADQATVTKSSAAGASAEPLRAASAKQGELRTLALGLQTDATATAPEASSYFSSAAGKMGRAATVLNTPDAISADKKAAIAEQQKQSDQALADAQAILEKKQQSLEQAAADLAKVEKAKEDISQLMQDQQKLATETAKAAESTAADAPKPQELAKQQQQMQQTAKDAQAQLPQSAQQAQQAMQDAQQAMQQAQQDLNQSQPQAAKPDQQQAMQQLAKAKDALDQTAAQLQQQLNQPPAEQRRSLGELANAIEKAQQEIDQSSEKLPPEKGKLQEAKEAAKELEKTQSDLAKLSAEESDQLPTEAKKAISEANEALAEAAAKANADKPAGAKEDAQAASDKLEAAKAALQLAMEGLQAGLPEMAQGPAAEPGPPMPGMSMPAAQPGPPGPSDNPTEGNQQPGGAGGPLGNPNGAGKFVALPERERQALISSGAAKYPEEYGPMIEQYLRNLSNEPQR